jgi:hypothetical protein
LGLGVFFGLGVKGLGGVFSIFRSTSSSLGDFGMGEYPDWILKQPYRPSPLNKGEEDRNALHLGVGLICHNWEHLEGRLYDLYVALFCHAHPQGVNYGAYQASYSAVISPKARMEMVGSMLDTVFHPMTCAHKEISPLLKLIGRAVGRRNDAAHGVVAKYNDMGLFIMPPRYAPIPTWRNSSKNGGEPRQLFSAFKYRYNGELLNEISLVIARLGSDLDQKTQDLERGLIGAFPERHPLPSR